MHGIDLHTHSNISDGSLTPQALVERAAQLGIHTLALTDHDSIEGVDAAKQAATQYGMRIIDGVEISSQWSRPATKKSYAVHIVALNMQNLQPLRELLQQQKQIRAERSIHICELLTPFIGQDIYADVLAKVDNHPDRVTRSHIAQTLVEKGYVSRVQQAFDKFLKQGKKAYVKFDGVSLAETIDIIHQSGGLAVLAHPTRYDLSATNIRYLIELFAQLGGDAVELPPTIEPVSTRQMVDRMIAEHGLKVSVGSDFHGDYMPWIKLGNIPSIKAGQVGIWEAFQ